MQIDLPEIKLDEKEVKLRLAISLFEDGTVSLGKAAQLSGYSEDTFSELLQERNISPIKYENIDLEREIKNA